MPAWETPELRVVASADEIASGTRPHYKETGGSGSNSYYLQSG